MVGEGRDSSLLCPVPDFFMNALLCAVSVGMVGDKGLLSANNVITT